MSGSLIRVVVSEKIKTLLSREQWPDSAIIRPLTQDEKIIRETKVQGLGHFIDTKVFKHHLYNSRLIWWSIFIKPRLADKTSGTRALAFVHTDNTSLTLLI